MRSSNNCIDIYICSSPFNGCPKNFSQRLDIIIILPTNGMKNRGLLVDPLEICFKCFPFLFQLLGNSASHHEFCAISVLTIFNVYKMQICALFNDSMYIYEGLQ